MSSKTVASQAYKVTVNRYSARLRPQKALKTSKPLPAANSRPRRNFWRAGTRALATTKFQGRRGWFQREINLYTDAKLLKTRLIGTAPINKENVHRDWSITRGRADLVERQASHALSEDQLSIHRYRTAYQVTCLTYSTRKHKNSNTQLFDTKSAKLASLNAKHTSKTRQRSSKHPSSKWKVNSLN